MKKLTLIFFSMMIIFPMLAAGAELTLIYTGSANGVLESCQCPGNPFGGLVNRAAVIDSLLEIYPEALVVDCGDFLPADGDSLKSVYVIKALGMIKIDAIAPGDQDFNLGRDFLVNSDLPLISPSLYNPDTRSYMFQNYLIKEAGNLKIALTSLISPGLFALFPDSLREQIGIEPPEASWKRFGPLLKEKADLIIVISHMGYDKDIEFLHKTAGIDILISGHSQVLLEEPETINESILLAPGKNGEHLGLLRLEIDSTGNIIGRTHEMIPLIAENVGESSEVRQLIEEYDDLLREKLRRQAIAAGRRYHGNDFCASCHSSEYEHWKTTNHAAALRILEKMSKADNTSCLECHTTGFGYPGGFVSKEETPELGGIGCEECHRIPLNTDFTGEKPHKILPVIEKWCTRCHKQPHIIEFDYEKMKKMVEHHD